MSEKTLIETLAESAKELGFDKITVDKLSSFIVPEVKKLSPNQIKLLRKEMRASQAVFAKYLNVTASTVQKWEQGVITPQGGTLKLLNLMKQKGVEILLDSVQIKRSGTNG